MNIDDILVWDIETLKEYSLFSFYNPKEEKWYEFSINKWENDLYSFVKFIEQNNQTYYFVGYNSMRFDAQVIEWIIRNYENWVDLSNLEITYLIWQKAQDIIDDMNYETFAEFHENQLSFKNIDIFKVYHLDNAARRRSLKVIEFEMDFDNIEEMPINHDTINLSLEDIDLIKAYCRNDISATYAFWNILRGKTEHLLYKGNDQIKLRIDIQKEFDIPCLNYSDSKIGDEIIKKYYCEEKKLEYKHLPKKGFFRKEVAIKNCVAEYIQFKTPQLQSFLNKIRKLKLSTKDDFKEIINFYGNSYSFMKGGLHAENKPEIFEIGDNYDFIQEWDCASMYPSTIINNKKYPQHLGKEFLTGYEKLFRKRIELKPLSKKNDAIKGIVSAIKLSLNAAYGKSSDMQSWMYDRQLTMFTTITGELSLMMLIEAYELEGIKVISANTDSITIIGKNNQLSKIAEINGWWEKITKYILEKTEYSKLVFSTVNDYLAVKIDGEIKNKGDLLTDFELHKNKSGRIIPLALKEYFTKGTPVEEFIYSYNNLFDFCYRAKSSKDFHYEGIKNGRTNIYNKLIRYYISTNGEKLFKIKNPECQTKAAARSEVNAGRWLGTVCNYIPNNSTNNKNIDYSFYIEKAKEMIFKVENGRKPKKTKVSENQISLF